MTNVEGQKECLSTTPAATRSVIPNQAAGLHRTSIAGDCKFIEYMQSVPINRIFQRGCKDCLFFEIIFGIHLSM